MAHGTRTADGARRVHAGRQRHGLCRLLAAPRHRARVPQRGLLREARRGRSKRGASTSCSSTTAWPCRGSTAGRSPRPCAPGPRPVKLDLSIVLGICAGVTEPDRAGGHVLDDLLHALPRGPDVRHARPSLGWARRLERRDVGQRQRGAELRVKEALPHDARYDRADEFLEATTGLWDSWEDDALVLDRETPLLRRSGQGARARLRGRLVLGPRPAHRAPAPQGRPLLMQAGSSGRGREFAARWAELIFTGDPGIDIARVALQGPEGEDRRARPRSRHGQDAARWPTPSSASRRRTPRSASSCSSTTWSTPWPR